MDITGVELCELNRSDGMLYPLRVVSFFQSGLVPPSLRPLVGTAVTKLRNVEQPYFICFITLVEKTGEFVCHCFLTPRMEQADDVSAAIEQAIDVAERTKPQSRRAPPNDDEVALARAL